MDDFLDDVLSNFNKPPVRQKAKPPGLPLQPVKKKKLKREAGLVALRRELGPVKRFYAQKLIECDTYRQAERAMTNAGYKTNRTTLYRWRRDPTFVKVYTNLQALHAAALAVNRDKILTDAEKAKEIALRPKHILYKGVRTGEKEVNVGAYIRATELQGKAIGVGNDEGQKVQVNIDIDYSGRVEGSTEAIDGELA